MTDILYTEISRDAALPGDTSVPWAASSMEIALEMINKTIRLDQKNHDIPRY